MSKTNIQNTSVIESFSSVAAKAGFALMFGATLLGMFDLHDQEKRIVPVRPIFNFAEIAPTHNFNMDNELMRREKESEVGAHAMSFSITQRTPSHAGKQ